MFGTDTSAHPIVRHAPMVTFFDLWYGHPTNRSVLSPCIAPRDGNFQGSVVSRGHPTFANQSAIRTGVALKRAGVTIDQLGGLATCGAHPPEELHFLRATEVARALADAKIPGIGPVERLTGEAPRDYYHRLYGRTGIIFVMDYWARSIDTAGAPSGDDIDLWNGVRTTRHLLPELFSWFGYYGSYTAAREIWFWEVR